MNKLRMLGAMASAMFLNSAASAAMREPPRARKITDADRERIAAAQAKRDRRAARRRAV